MSSFPLLTPRQAAEHLGISYAQVKHWIHSGRIRTGRTVGGHHRVSLATLEEFLQPAKSQLPRLSGPNQLRGTVLEVTIRGMVAKVVLAVGTFRITAIIPSEAADDLALRPGDAALALIDATEVMIIECGPGSVPQIPMGRNLA